MKNINAPTHTGVAARIRLNGGKELAPAISDYPFADEATGTPSIATGLTRDVYVRLDAAPAKAGDPVQITVIIEPLVWWVWAGGLLLVAGAGLSAFPGRRRRPTDPVSAPVPVAEGSRPADLVGAP